MCYNMVSMAVAHEIILSSSHFILRFKDVSVALISDEVWSKMDFSI